MARVIIVFLFIQIIFSSFAQDTEFFEAKKDFYRIRIASRDSLSDAYYKKLINIFHRPTDYISNNEVLALMIGFTNSPDYKPFDMIEKEKHIIEQLSKANKKTWSECTDLLRKDPLNYLALMQKAVMAPKIEKDSADYYRALFSNIEQAIMFSGDGSLERPFFILNPIDGQIFANIRNGWKIVNAGTEKDESGYMLDFLDVMKEGKKERLYFNVTHAKLSSDGLLDKMEKDWASRQAIDKRMIEVEAELKANEGRVDAFVFLKAESELTDSLLNPNEIAINRNVISSNIIYGGKSQILDAIIKKGANIIDIRKNGVSVRTKIVDLKGGESLEISIKVHEYNETQRYYDVEVVVTEN